MTRTTTRCEADTYYGGVCRGTLQNLSYGAPHCPYADSHLFTVDEPYVHRLSSSPGSPFHVIGRAVLLTATRFHEMAQYPGADRVLMAQPQTVMLASNGYYCAYRVSGEVTGRGHYGGEVGVTEDYVARPYAYEVVAALTERDGLNRDGSLRYELAPGVVLEGARSAAHA